MKKSLKGFSWVGNFPFWVGKFGKYFLTCNDFDGFFGFSKFNRRKSFDQPCHFNSWNPTGLYMYVPQTALALAHEKFGLADKGNRELNLS